ncbi:MAG: ATP-binding cassette domain-containing protein [Clostridium sp.]
MLKVSNINYSYGKKKALEGINFQAEKGIVALLGPNGAGKTTLSKILTTTLKCKGSSIELNGTSYNKLDKIRGEIGYLPQNFDAFPMLSGREFLTLINELKGTKSDINNVAHSLRMEKYIDDKINSYSGGMKQKLGIAQAIIGDSKLVILDEPTVGLDPEQRNSIRNLFPVISNDRVVIITTHITEDIDFYCDYVIVINTRLLFAGSKTDFINLVKGKIWSEVVTNKEFIELSNKYKVVARKQIEEQVEVRYISDSKRNDSSIRVSPTVEDAYLYVLGSEEA